MLLKPSLENFQDYFASVWDEYNRAVVWTFFGIAFFGDSEENGLFQICWHTECSTFTASPFRIWNSSTGIPSPPLALFAVIHPKAHLISHYRMSGSRWVVTPSWLSGPRRSFFVCFFRVFLPSLLLLLGLYHLCPLFCHLCMKCSVGASNFLEAIPSLSHSIIFLYFFALIS